MALSLEGGGLRVRGDLAASHARAWAAIAAPGTWLDGARRVAVAAEIRHARGCAHCARIRDALSPNAVDGAHDSLGALGAAEVELIHRVSGDPGRLSERWSQSVLAQGLTEGEYVEIVGIIAMVMMMDACTRALGLPESALPAPQPGEPARYRPPGAKKQAAWLSLVPQSLRDYWDLAFTHYLPGDQVYRFDASIRAISRPQVEVLAARVSALHQCAY